MKKIYFVILFFSKGLSACECPPLAKLSKTDVEKYDVVFMGMVDSVSACHDNAEAWFRVKFLFRGNIFQEMPVRFDCSSDCMMSFEKGEHWIIYGNYYSYGSVETNLCSHTRKYIEDKAKDFYMESSKISFEEELIFLTNNYGNKEIISAKIPNSDLPRVNIQPGTVQKMILVIVSIFTLLFFYFLVNKFWKN